MDLENSVKKGTTTLGIIFDGGVLLAADSQSTSAYVESRYERKIHPITGSIGITTAGVVGDIQYLIRLLKAEAQLYEMGNGNPTTKGMVTLLSNIMHGNRYYPLIAAMVIGGYDTAPRLFSIDPYGGIGRGEKYFSTGSGSPLAMGVLESQFTDGLSEADAIKLARSAISAAISRDIYTGGKKLKIAIIDKNGYREI